MNALTGASMACVSLWRPARAMRKGAQHTSGGQIVDI
jgi:hypothetical protein